jgi:hypothetical protein
MAQSKAKLYQRLRTTPTLFILRFRASKDSPQQREVNGIGGTVISITSGTRPYDTTGDNLHKE